MTATVGELFAASGVTTREARALLAYALGTTRERLIAHPELIVADAAADAFRTLAGRRRQGEPLAYLLGVQEFYGRSFTVTPAVLVPRPETELLVELALARMRRYPAPCVLDLGTGSGAIAITLALEYSNARITATDLMPAALEVARGNAERLHAKVDFRSGSWYAALPSSTPPFDLIVANPPYVAQADSHLHALRFEPQHALTDGSGGLASLSAVVAGAAAHVAPAGWLIVEHGYDQGEDVREIFSRHGWLAHSYVDAAQHPRVTLGQRG